MGCVVAGIVFMFCFLLLLCFAAAMWKPILFCTAAYLGGRWFARVLSDWLAR